MCSSISSTSSYSQPGVGSRYSNFFSSGLRAISRRQNATSHFSIPVHRPPPCPYLNRRHVPPMTSFDTSVIQYSRSSSQNDALSKFSGVKHLEVIIRTFQPSLVKSVSDKYVTTSDEKRVRTRRWISDKHDRSFLCFDGDSIMSDRSLLMEKSMTLEQPPKSFRRSRCLSTPSPSSFSTDHSFISLSPMQSEASTPMPSRPSTPQSLPPPLIISVSRKPARRSRQDPVPLWTQRRCAGEWDFDPAGPGYTRARYLKYSKH